MDVATNEQRRAFHQAQMFAKQRFIGAQNAMNGLLGKGMDPFAGTFETLGEMPKLSGDPALKYAEALKAFAAGQGATVGQLAPSDYLPGQPGREVPPTAPPSTLLIGTSLPNVVMLDANAVADSMFEAIAEVLRVVLVDAILAAKDDCESGEGVKLMLRSEPQFLATVDIEGGVIRGFGRIRAVVHCEKAPNANYLLGSIVGQPQGFQIGYELPLAEMVYGDNRIRWKDRRAPDCTALIQLVGGVA